MNNTLLLNPQTWDLLLDVNGNIALASPPYALAQDVASQCKLFQGELWYDTSQGIPYFQNVLGQYPPFALLKSYFNVQALLVPGVVKTHVVTGSFINRVYSGTVNFIDTNGAANNVSF